MPLTSPFSSDGFNMLALTAAINHLPNKYGLLNEMNLMPIRSVTNRNIAIEEFHGQLALLPTMPVGSSGTVGDRGRRTVRSLYIPHIPHLDIIKPEEVQGVRAFGSENSTDALTNVMLRKLQSLRNKHAITLEHLRIGALKGIILDADGSILYNLFDEFKITQTTFNFNLFDNNIDVRRKCLDLKRHMEDNLRGEIMTDVECLVSSEFFDALTGHEKVIKAYELWQNGEAARSDMRQGFLFGGILFKEYRGTAVDMNGTARRFIAEAEGHAFPVGTMNTFATYVAPADFMETVNTPGQELYVKQKMVDFDRGIEVHSQSNPLPICHKPAILVKVTAE